MAVNQTVEEKLKCLFELQRADSEIDRLRKLRGELPDQILDMEEEIEGLKNKNLKIENEIKAVTTSVTDKKNEITICEEKIEKYKTQQNDVKNNREFDSLTKEIEFQNLEIQLCKKRIKEYTVKTNDKKDLLKIAKDQLKEKQLDLKQKKDELDEIVADTQKDEEKLITKSKELSKKIEERILFSYNRLRGNMSNRLAIVSIQRNSCGGCFNQIPPQRILDIATRKKLIVCEHCGRILVDSVLPDEI